MRYGECLEQVKAMIYDAIQDGEVPSADPRYQAFEIDTANVVMLMHNITQWVHETWGLEPDETGPIQHIERPGDKPSGS